LAAEYFTTARNRFVALSDREGEMEALRNEGYCLLALADGFMSTDPGEAISVVKRALRSFRAAGDKHGEANALMMLGNIHQNVSQYAVALDYAEQAESLFRSIGDRHSATYALNLRSSCHHALSQYELSLECGERALHSFCNLGDAGGEASALVTLSCVYEVWGEFQQAIDYCLEALEIYRGLDRMVEVASSLERLGAYYSQVGDTELAAECRRQSLELARVLDVPWLLANGLQSAGQSLIDQGDLTAAIAPLEEALGMFREMESLNGEADCLAPLLDCYMSLGRLRGAIECAESIVAIGRESGDQRIECNGLMSLGNVQLRLGNLKVGTDFLEQSLRIAQEIGARGMEGDLHRQLASCYWSLGRLDDAGMHYESAIEGIEQTFGGLEMEALQESFFPRVRELYVEYFMFLLATGDMDETLWVAERCRARTFLGLVAEKGEDVLQNVPEEGIRTGVVAPEIIDRDLQEVVASLPANTVALEYFVTNDATYVWVIKEGVVEGPIEIHHGREELMEKVIECRQRLERTDLMANRDLAILYDWLIRPVEDLLPTGTQETPPHLVIIPSGPLYYLPFQALLGTSADRSEQFRLIERYVVSYSPSLVMLKYATANDVRTSDATVFLGLADPDPGDPSLRLPDAQDEIAQVAKMFTDSKVYVGAEATESILQEKAQQASYVLIAAHGKFNPQNPMYSYLLLTPTQTSDGKLNTYEVFGLGLHAEMVVLSACETLLPAVEELKVEERLTRGLGTDTPIELTEEQLEELTRGDEVAGLTRAFIAAGASSVVSSLWSVPSEATTALMVSLYTHLQEGMSKAQALRAAQLEVMNTSRWTQPWYWAAFNLMGNWR